MSERPPPSVSFRPRWPPKSTRFAISSFGRWGMGSSTRVPCRGPPADESLGRGDLRRDEAWVTLVDGAVAGFYRLSRAGECAEIEEFHLPADGW